MAFEDIAGQDRVVARLRQAISVDRLTSGLIFYGSEGVGKRRTAFELARALNCLTGRRSCGCESCLKIARDSHPDLLYIEPDGQVITVEQVEPLIARAMLRPYEGRKRIYIFDRADRIVEKTASRLLKTLEEPPLYTHFILLTSNLPAVLPTIRSRCGLFHFRDLSAVEVERILLEEFQMSKEEAARRAGLSRGSLGRAMALDERDFSLQDEVMRWLAGALANGDRAPGELIASLVKRIEEGGRSKIDIPDLIRKIEVLMDLVRDVMVGARRFRGLTDFAEAYDLFMHLAQARTMIQGNVSPETTLEEVLIYARSAPMDRWRERFITTLSWA